MNQTGDSITDVVKLTLHVQLDADVIAIIKAMPRSKKARMIVDAIRATYGEGQGTKKIVPAQVEAKAPEPVAEPAPTPVKRKSKVNIDAF